MGGQNKELRHPDWTDQIPTTVEICRKQSEESSGGQKFHLRVVTKKRPFRYIDKEMTPSDMGMEIAGFSYGRWFWELSRERKEYLLCNMAVQTFSQNVVLYPNIDTTNWWF